ncbi:MAG: LysR family transcriptional regulator [Pseudomonadota bacterium]|nr:LysR family transcriptional regulator [Pseudomonadota bacterium]
MIETASLRYFREVAAQGSLRHAAERLYIAQSALSRQIRTLEAELGVALFERRARGMVLTAAGRLLLEYIDDSRARLDELRSRIQDFETLHRGEVDIACVEGLLNGFMPGFVECLQAEHEGLVLRVAAMGSQSVAEAVAEHRFDLGILFGQSPRGDLVEIARMSQPLCAIVAAGHPLAHRRSCRLSDVAPFGVVMPDRSFGIRQLIDRVRAVDRVDLRIVLETNTLAFAWRMVLRTRYVTFQPLDSVRREVVDGQLVAVPLDEKLLRGTRVTLVASPSRTLSPAADWTRERLKAAMAASARQTTGGRRAKR